MQLPPLLPHPAGPAATQHQLAAAVAPKEGEGPLERQHQIYLVLGSVPVSDHFLLCRGQLRITCSKHNGLITLSSNPIHNLSTQRSTRRCRRYRTSPGSGATRARVGIQFAERGGDLEGDMAVVRQ